MTQFSNTNENFGTAAENAINPAFREKINAVMKLFFSRNKEYWSCFQDPSFKKIVGFRRQNLHPDEKIIAYPNGETLHNKLIHEEKISKNFSKPKDSIDEILVFSAALSKNWENPSSVKNVITMHTGKDLKETAHSTVNCF